MPLIRNNTRTDYIVLSYAGERRKPILKPSKRWKLMSSWDLLFRGMLNWLFWLGVIIGLTMICVLLALAIVMSVAILWGQLGG
jgi:sensor histidine kinase YesM